jgi:hypothetical protein
LVITIFLGTSYVLEAQQENISLDSSGWPNVPSADPSTAPKNRFFTFEGEADWIFKSRFTTPENAGQRIGFSESDIFLSYTQLLNSCEGVGIGAGYSWTHLDWDQNPFFSEENFPAVTFSVDGFSKRFPSWVWKGSFSVDMQTDEFGDGDYNLYNLTIWGRYGFYNYYVSDLGLNIGFVGRTGLEQTIAWPIVGLDFHIYRDWKINVVYPVNMSLIYSLNDNWSLAFAGRIWNTRRRVSESEVLPKGIFEYRNSGVEFVVNYKYCDYANANFHVGSTVGTGDLKIVDSRNHTIRHNKFREAAYLGGAFDFKF